MNIIFSEDTHLKNRILKKVHSSSELLRSFWNEDGDDNENVKKSNRFIE